ncbi:MAG: glycosyltransferase family 4 protein [Bacteroidales bacterium]|jgi:glycosyltransferase involved in cell wall biosynthesis|nr:glycosyltransferase family 4 protein [Bacteroidales bacterium]
MDILFLMLTAPDFGNPMEGGMYSELAKTFLEKGHNVFPVAPALSYNKKTAIVKEGDFDVLRINTLDLFSVSSIKKGIANILLSYQYKKAITKYYKKYKFDLIIVPTPSVLFADVAVFLKKHFSAEVYLILRDIFPQNAVDLNMIKENSLIYKFFRSKEQKLYKVADKIGCSSQANIDYVIAHNQNVDKNKLHILYNFQKKTERKLPDPEIKEKYNIDNKFVIVFGGNFGIPQKIENVIAFAKRCEIYQDVELFLIGKGTQRHNAENLVKKANVINIRFVDFVPLNEYKSLLQFCSIGLISLNEKFTVPNTPYKLCDYFDAGIPVLASIDSATDLGKILVESNTGLYSQAGNTDQLISQLEILYNDKDLRRKMGKNGQKFYDDYMTTEVAYNVIMSNILNQEV